ncbi:sensor domain-containing diguanylate cyclase [Photobacterium sp. J15]|uniref:sensor domain-containing diguanylate cyclase n=1 Tax=Photobacterium sp. J15 TaxID=265901 RepID=UPI000A651118|nr:sensor domain-containing diguanylate cyclase [Photobacterium sp. J15]
MINQLLHAHRAFNKILRMLALGQSKQEMLEQLIGVTEKIYSDRMTSVLLLDDNSNTLHCECAPNLPESYKKAIDGIPIGPDVGACGAAAYFRRKVITENISEHQNWIEFKQITQKVNLASCWSVPIISSKDKVLGTFATYSSYPSSPTPFELEVLEMAASVCAVALEKHEIEQELLQSANYDFLTNVYNRRVFCQKLQQELDDVVKEGLLALFYIDIDQFKTINDQHGHIFGDQVLVETASRLRQISRHTDIVGRLGGDEFVLLASCNDQEDFYELYHELANVFNKELTLKSIPFSASVGFVTIDRNEAFYYDIQSLISAADKHMYQCKHEHKQLCSNYLTH